MSGAHDRLNLRNREDRFGQPPFEARQIERFARVIST